MTSIRIPTTAPACRDQLCELEVRKWLRTESPTQDALKDAVLRMREKGKATGCNSAIRAINAYLHWRTAGTEVKCSPACKHLRIAQLKEPQVNSAHVHHPSGYSPCELEAQEQDFLATALASADSLPTGSRVGEALSIRVLIICSLFDKIYAPLLLHPFPGDRTMTDDRLHQLDKLYQSVAAALDELVAAG